MGFGLPSNVVTVLVADLVAPGRATINSGLYDPDGKKTALNITWPDADEGGVGRTGLTQAIVFRGNGAGGVNPFDGLTAEADLRAASNGEKTVPLTDADWGATRDVDFAGSEPGNWVFITIAGDH